VTHDRQPILLDHFDLLWNSIAAIQSKSPFELIAWVVLPDHMHLLIDPKAEDISQLMKRIKLSFSTRLRKRERVDCGRYWQYRF
jgi:putative transposase